MFLFYIIIFAIVFITIILYLLTTRIEKENLPNKLHNNWIRKLTRKKSSSSMIIKRKRKPLRTKCNDSASESTQQDECCNSVIKKKYLYLDVVKNKTNLKAYTNTELSCNSFKTVLNFNYCSKRKHKALFMIKGIKGILSRVTDGIAIINRNGKHEEIYNYISSYNREDEIMYITILSYDEIVELCGCVKIKLVMCEEKDKNKFLSEKYKHPEDKGCGMCR